MNVNLSEMIGKHCHNEIQDMFPYSVLLVRSVMKTCSLHFLNLTPCHHYRSKEYPSAAGYKAEKKAS